MFLWFSFRYGVWNIHVKRNLSKTYWHVVQTKNSKHVRVLVSELHLTLKRLYKLMWLVEFQSFKKKVLAPFQCFIPVSAFYPHFSVLSPIQRFIPNSAFYPHFGRSRLYRNEKQQNSSQIQNNQGVAIVECLWGERWLSKLRTT